MPKYVEEQFVAAAKRIGLRIEPRADGLWRVEHVLADLRSEKLRCVQRLGKVDAVLLGPGHPLYAAVDERLNETLSADLGGTAFFIDPLAAGPYRLHFFEITIKGKDTRSNDVLLHAEVVAVREEGGQFEVVPADVLIDLAPYVAPASRAGEVGAASRAAPDIDAASGSRSARGTYFDPQPAADHLKSTYQIEARQRCQQDRQQYASVVCDYLERSFKARISKAQERYMRLMAELGIKPEYKLATDEAKRHVDDLERSKKERLAGLDRLQIARTGPIRHLATAVVLTAEGDVAEQVGAPGREPDVNLRKQKELRAEEIVIEDLVADGFPRDNIARIGKQKLGFDLRAHRVTDDTTGVIEVRRIEVKGYTRGNDIQLTTNEWYKAQQLGPTYWLCVVWDPLRDDHELIRIRNPAEKPDHAKKEVVVAKMFTIPAPAIDQHGKKARK